MSRSDVPVDTDRARRRLDEPGADPGNETIVRCRIGERSTHTRFVLGEPLGRPAVGSWAEHGSLIGAPAERRPSSRASRGARPSPTGRTAEERNSR